MQSKDAYSGLKPINRNFREIIQLQYRGLLNPYPHHERSFGKRLTNSIFKKVVTKQCHVKTCDELL